MKTSSLRATSRQLALLVIIGILGFSWLPLAVYAQTPDTVTSTPPAATATALATTDTSPVTSGLPTIISIKKLGQDNAKELGLGDYIQIKVNNLAAFYNNPAKDSSIILFLNDIPMLGIAPLSNYAADNTLTFQLSRDSVARKSWDAFYEYPRHNQNNVRIALGNKSGITTASYPTGQTLVITPKYSVALSTLFTAVLLVLLIYLARKSYLLKDSSTLQRNKPYSFSRVQLAFWTYIIISAYFFIYLTSGELAPITGSTLILLSISTATAATATFIDTDQQRNGKPRHQDLKTEGFFTDIVSDAQGVSIHRLQVILWNLIMGLAFIRAVIKDLSMPQFDEGLMLLMGISNTAYLSLKTQENQATSVQSGQTSQTNTTDLTNTTDTTNTADAASTTSATTTSST